MQMISAVRYQTNVYLRTSRPIMPFAVLLLLVGLLYSLMPVLPADSYAASTTILCFISAWIGMSCVEMEEQVSAQLVALKLGGIVRYQIAFTVFLALVGLFASALAVALPLLVNAVNGFALYKEPITATTVANALMLHICAAFMGGAVGAFFHPRYFPDRKIVYLLLGFVLLVGFVKPGIHNRLPFTVAFTWLFPPISAISEMLAGNAYFPADTAVRLSARCLLYGLTLTAIRIGILARQRFS